MEQNSKEPDLIPYITTHPGIIILYELQERRIKTKFFARELGISHRMAKRILIGEEEITEEMAIKIGEFLSIDPKTIIRMMEVYKKNTQNNP